MDLYLLFGIFIFLLALFLGFRDPKKGFLFLIFLLPFNHKKTLGLVSWNLTPPRVFLVGFVLGFFIYVLRNEKNWKQWFRRFWKDKFFVFLVFLWVVRGFSLFRSANIEMGLGMWGFSTAVLFFYIIFRYLVIRYGGKFLKQASDLYLKLGLVIGAFGVVQLILYVTQEVVFLGLWPIEDGLARVGATFWDINHYAAFSASVALLFFGRFILSSNREATLNFLAFLFMVLMVGLTSSQSGMVFLLVGFVVVSSILLFRNYRKKYSFIFALVLFLVLASGIYFFRLGLTTDSNLRQVLKINFTLRDDSVASHYHLAQGALEIFKEKLLLGCGYGSFNECFRNTPIIDTYLERDPVGEARIPPHSIWFGALAETGALGFFALLGLFAVLFQRCFKNIFKSQNNSQFVQNSIYLGILLGVSSAGLVYSYNLLFFWFLLFLVQEESLGDALSLAKVDFWPRFKNWLVYNKEILILTFLVLFSGTFMFWFLWRNALIPWDEAIYAGVSRELVEGGDIWTLYWNREPFFEKPPLFFWLQAISFVYFDFKPFAARLPVALFGILGVVMTYIFGKKLFSKRVGLFGSLFLATTIHWVAWSRTAMLDVPAAVLILCSLYFFWESYVRAADSPKPGFGTGLKAGLLSSAALFGVFLGLTFMMKGPVAVVPAAVAVIFLAVNGLFRLVLERLRQPQISNDEFLISNWGIGNWFLIRIIRSIRLIRSIFIPFLLTTVSFLLVTVPWHWLMIARHGESFVEEYFGYHILKRASESIEMHGRPFWWFNIVIRHWARHWYVVGLVALAALVSSLVFYFLKRWGEREISPSQKSGLKLRNLVASLLEIEDENYEAELFLLLWLLLTFFIFSASESKIQWYIIPIYPPLALLCGWFVDRLCYLLEISFRNFKFRVLNFKLKDSFIGNLSAGWRIVISGARVRYTVLATVGILVVGVSGLLYWHRMWFPENLNRQVAELSDHVWRIPGEEKKFYVADAPPPLPIFYSGLKVTTVAKDGVSKALDKKHVAVLSKKSTYRQVLEDVRESGRPLPLVFKETEDYILYGY